MQIRQRALLDLMGEPGVRFSIPRFQRSYSWGVEQCDELWRDILRAARAHRSHFVGTLIYCEDGGGLTVVDGQQRLTTVTLLLVALARHLDRSGVQLFGLDGASIASTYLVQEGRLKLSLSAVDAPSLEAVVRGAELPERPSAHIVENLANFEAKMLGEGFDTMELLSGLQSLVVISAELDDKAQAPAVFESFNSKGVPLVTADLVRNFLLLAESHAEQSRLYEKYWAPICGVFGDDPGSLKLNNAILGWLAVRLKAARKFGDAQAFSIFKSFCEDEYEGTVDDLLEELYAFCMVWAEHYRYHAVKKYKTADWATLGHKTRVSNRKRAPMDNPDSAAYYKKHFGVDPQW